MNALVAVELNPVDKWAAIIRADLGRAVEGIVAAGQHLRQAKEEVAHGGWLPLLKALRLDESAAQRLMKIAGNEVLANPAYWAAFPPSWRTLYELTKLPPKVLEAKIIDGVITPRIERKGVVSLKNEITAMARLRRRRIRRRRKRPLRAVSWPRRLRLSEHTSKNSRPRERTGPNSRPRTRRKCAGSKLRIGR